MNYVPGDSIAFIINVDETNEDGISVNRLKGRIDIYDGKNFNKDKLYNILKELSEVHDIITISVMVEECVDGMYFSSCYKTICIRNDKSYTDYML